MQALLDSFHLEGIKSILQHINFIIQFVNRLVTVARIYKQVPVFITPAGLITDRR